MAKTAPTDQYKQQRADLFQFWSSLNLLMGVLSFSTFAPLKSLPAEWVQCMNGLAFSSIHYRPPQILMMSSPLTTGRYPTYNARLSMSQGENIKVQAHTCSTEHSTTLPNTFPGNNLLKVIIYSLSFETVPLLFFNSLHSSWHRIHPRCVSDGRDVTFSFFFFGTSFSAADEK